MKNRLNEFINVENEFYELDQENKKAIMRLEFNKVSDIFDMSLITKTPMLNDVFSDWVKCSFEYAPRKYKIDLDISFSDMEGYTSEEMKDIFLKNVYLEAKKTLRNVSLKNNIAYGLIVLGVLFFIAMMLINNLVKDGGIFKDIICYIMDIATTVTFWEALTILIVETKEKGDLGRNLMKRFDSINFHLK